MFCRPTSRPLKKRETSETPRLELAVAQWLQHPWQIGRQEFPVLARYGRRTFPGAAVSYRWQWRRLGTKSESQQYGLFRGIITP